MRVLVIGDGPSAKNLTDFDYDYIVGVNNSIRLYPEHITHHICLEKVATSVKQWLAQHPLRADQIRVRHPWYVHLWGDHCGKTILMHNKMRKPTTFAPTKPITGVPVCSADNKQCVGLLWNMDGRFDCTVALHAVHYAMILGGQGSKIDIVGCEGMYRRGDTTHSYGDCKYDDIYYDRAIDAYTRPCWKYTDTQIGSLCNYAKQFDIEVKNG